MENGLSRQFITGGTGCKLSSPRRILAVISFLFVSEFTWGQAESDGVVVAKSLNCAVIDIYIDGHSVSRFGEKLQLTDRQIGQFQDLYRAYATRTADLDAATQKDMNDAGLARCRKLRREAKQSGEALDREEYDRHFRAYKAVRAQGLRRSDVVLNQLFAQLEQLLTESQRESLERVKHWLFRHCYQRPMRADGIHLGDFAIDHIDVVDFTHEWLQQRVWPAFDEFQLDRSTLFVELLPILDDYDAAFHAIIISSLRRARAKPGHEMSSFVVVDGSSLRDSGWNRRFDITYQAILAIAETIDENAPALAFGDEYLSEFYLLFCPELFADRVVDELAALWLAGSISIPTDQADLLAPLYDAYRVERERLRMVAVRRGIAAKKATSVAFGTAATPHEQVEQMFYELRRLTQNSTIAMVQAVDPESGQAMGAAALSLIYGDSSLCGPTLREFQNEAVSASTFKNRLSRAGRGPTTPR